MSQNDNLHLAQEFLGRMASGAEPIEIAKLFSETLEWEIAGDIGALPWIGCKSGRDAVTDFVRDLNEPAGSSRQTSRLCSPSLMV